MRPVYIPTYHVKKDLTYLPPKRKTYPWLLKILLRVGKWIKEFEAPPAITHYEEIRIDFGDLIKDIGNHVDQMRRDTGMRPKYLILGRDKYYQMTHKVKNEYPQALGPFMEPDWGYLFGLEIIIVPWIDGLFVLPDLDQIRSY